MELGHLSYKVWRTTVLASGFGKVLPSEVQGSLLQHGCFRTIGPVLEQKRGEENDRIVIFSKFQTTKHTLKKESRVTGRKRVILLSTDPEVKSV